MPYYFNPDDYVYANYDPYEDEEEEYRNAGPAIFGSGRRRPRRPDSRHFDRRRPRPGMMPAPRPPVIGPRSPVIRPVRPERPMPERQDNDHLTIKKSALAELVPVAGQAIAAFLGRPDLPMVVGDDIVDRTNAAMHRDALAMHQQNQTRILALSDLAARAIKLFI